MAAFKPLLDAECGTTNPLIKLSQFYIRDNTLVTQDGLINLSTNDFTNTNQNSSNNTIIDEFVNEYHRPIAAPTTFHLEGLLTGLHLPNDTANKHENEWTKQFLNSPSNNNFSSSVIHPPPVNQQHSQWTPWNEQNYVPSTFMLNPTSTFLDQQSFTTDARFDNNTVQAAQHIFSFLQETQSAADTELKTFDGHVTTETNAGEWQHDLTADAVNPSSLNDHSRLQSMFQQFMDNVDNYSEYKFTKTNPCLDRTNPFEEGLKRLEAHDIVNAVLLFEAAVQKQPDHVDAWLYLGITQSENEQDGPAICALKKCVELDSKNLQAYITLASCYANEMLINEALDSLRNWLSNNAKYSHLLSTHLTTTNEMKMIDDSAFEELQELFLQAIALSNNPNDIDSDLQVCLGVLFHLPGDYDKAAQCFNTAVLAKPNDALLWNKLGAALANGGQCEKAVGAYYHALTLSPGFVRARYNLGISCFNLSAYKQAVEHFLTALKQQSNGIGPQGTHVQMSENIWRTLASVINRLKRPDLEQCVAYKDLPKLLQEFQIE